MTSMTEDLEADLPYITQRLQGRNADLYSDYNRLQAEADFRLAVFSLSRFCSGCWLSDGSHFG
jgi:hypothetical protein